MIFFSKSNEANKASLKGYYNKVEFKNNSKYKAEIFGTAFEIGESSK